MIKNSTSHVCKWSSYHKGNNRGERPDHNSSNMNRFPATPCDQGPVHTTMFSRENFQGSTYTTLKTPVFENVSTPSPGKQRKMQFSENAPSPCTGVMLLLRMRSLPETKGFFCTCVIKRRETTMAASAVARLPVVVLQSRVH